MLDGDFLFQDLSKISTLPQMPFNIKIKHHFGFFLLNSFLFLPPPPSLVVPLPYSHTVMSQI